MFNIDLTEKEILVYIAWLNKNRMYKRMNTPLGNPWEPWMQDTLDKLKKKLNNE